MLSRYGSVSYYYVTSTDINECTSGRHDCGAGMLCENTKGGYNCACPPGFKTTASDPPCTGNHVMFAVCMIPLLTRPFSFLHVFPLLISRDCCMMLRLVEIGSMTSSCRDADINECFDYSESPCPKRCVNTIGSFKCVCPPGLKYLADQKSCVGLILSSDRRQSAYDRRHGGATYSYPSHQTRFQYVGRTRRSAEQFLVNRSSRCKRGFWLSFYGTCKGLTHN